MAGLSSLTSVGPANASDRPSVLVVGGVYVGSTVAAHLSDEYEVTFVSRTREAVDRTAKEGVDARHVESIDGETLKNEGIDRASVVVAASAQDSVNLLVAQLARVRFGTENVIARVNDPDRVDPFRELGVEPVCLSTSVLEEVSERLETIVDELPQR